MMTNEEALKKLISAKKRAAKTKQEIEQLTTFLLKNGIDLDGSRARDKRNQKMYRQRLKGMTFTEIAKTVNLRPQTVRVICERITFRLNRKKKIAAGNLK